MSDANRTALRYVQESTFGTTPATPDMQNLRLTGESLGQDTNTITSNEIRSDRQVADVVRVGLSASGDVNGELSYGTYDDWLAAALLSADWSTAISFTSNAYGVTAGVGQYTITRAAGSFVADGYAANQWVKISGFATAANNGYAKIVSVAALSLVVSRNGNGVNEAAGANVTLKSGNQIVNGTTFRSYAIEREFQDLANEFSIFNGMTIDTFNMNVAADAILTVGFGFLGKTEASATATAANSTTAATTTDVMNAVDDVQVIQENGDNYDVTALNFALSNNLRQRLQVGTLGAISIGTGTVSITGGHSAYYNSKTVMDRYLNFTKTSVAFVVEKGGNAYLIEFPSIKYTSGRRVAGGINTDILAEMQFTAYRDATEGITVRIQRFPAA